MTDAKAGFKGLITATAETASEPGALRIADNVVLRRRGALMPRQAFVSQTLSYSGTGKTFLAAHVLGTETIYEGQSANSGLYNSSGSELVPAENGTLSLGVSATRMRADIRDAAAMRGSLYVPLNYGVGKVSGASATELSFTGVTPLKLGISTFNSSTSTLILPNNSQVAYRIVGKRTDANGLITRSRPTGAVVLVNTTGGPTAPAVQVYSNFLPTSVYNELEIYRTRIFPTSIPVDDEMQLVATVAWQFSSTFSFLDTVADIARGVTLYTSPSRGGIESANDQPPACACIEPFKQSMVFGNIRGPQRFVLSYKWADRTGSATGVGYRTVTGTVTSGSNQVTGLSSTTGLQQGMVLWSVNSTAPYTVWITAISGTTATLNINWPASTSAGATLVFSDAVQIGSTWHALYPGGTLQRSLNGTAHGAYNLTPAASNYDYTTVFETFTREAGSYTLRGTHGDEMYPALPLFAAATTAAGTSAQDIYPNGLNWTPPDEPEHCPPKYSALVGDKAKAILGLVALRDAMFIVKEDGIWRLVGVNGNFTIAPFDLTTFCILPSSIRRLDNAFYMLSNKGVVRISDNGVEVLSEPIRPEVTRLIDDVRTNFAATSLYSITGMSGTASSVDSRNSEYLLSLGTANVGITADLLVYNALADGFSTFSFSKVADALGFTPTGYGVRADDAVLALHANGIRGAAYNRLTINSESLALAADGASAITITSAPVTGAVAAVNYTPPLQFAVGDVIQQGTSAWRVLTAPSATQVTVAVGQVSGSTFVYPSAPANGAATVYRSITCTVEPQGFLAPEVLQKFWTHGAWAYSRLVGPVRIVASFASATPNVDLATQTITEQLEVPYQAGYARHTAGALLRQPVPMPHRRGWLLRLQTSLQIAFGDFILEVVSAESRDDVPNRRGTSGTGAT